MNGNLQQGKGCAHCKYTGYRGRIAVFEMLILDGLIRDAILSKKTSYDIRRISIEKSGLVTLFEDGLLKAVRGMTTEVARENADIRRLEKLALVRVLALGSIRHLYQG